MPKNLPVPKILPVPENSPVPENASPALTRQRLDAVRDVLKQNGFDALLVPRRDVHQGEEVAPCDERLRWLTGFSGSAGYALITLTQAHMFVDGRYSLQVRDQSPAPLFCHHALADMPPWRFLTPEHGRVAFDPWLFSKAQLGAYKADLRQAGKNPVDAVWHDRPVPVTGRIWAHSAEFAGRSGAEKRRQAASVLKQKGASAFVFTLPDSIAWLLNIRGSDLANTPVVRSFAILFADATCRWFVPKDRVPPEVLHDGLTLAEPDAFEDALKALDGLVLADPATAPVALYDLLADPGDLEDPVLLPKAKKNRAELSGIRAAHRRDAVAVNAFIKRINATAPGQTIDELGALQHLRREREKLNGFICDSFDTISGAGPNGAIVHYRATESTNRSLKQGELYLVDSGGQYLDGTTDITRTLCIGTPDAEQRRAYTLVLKGHIALALAKFPPGTTGAALDVLARQFLWAEGMDYDHGTGHGVGACLNVHEGPARIAKPGASAPVPLEPGMILSNEPGYYKTGAFGIRLENLMAVQTCAPDAEGSRTFLEFETLSFVPFEDKLIDRTLLTAREQAWLEVYHARCDEILNV